MENTEKKQLKEKKKDKDKEKTITEENKGIVEEKKENIEINENNNKEKEIKKEPIKEEKKEEIKKEEVKEIKNEEIKEIKKEEVKEGKKEEIKEEKKEEIKEEEKGPDYKEECIKLKNLLAEYEQGNKLSEKTKNDIDLIKTESLSQINQLRAKLDELTSTNLTKFKEYEAIISSNNIEISQKNKTISEYESIALKQEEKIDKLTSEVEQLNKAIFNKDLSMKENENYSNQLINIINEHKLLLKKLTLQKIDEENEEITKLKRQVKTLKDELEIEKKIKENIKKNHQSLQGKYFNICYNVKKKEQEELIRQAKFLSKDNINRHFIKNKFKLNTINRSGSLEMLNDKRIRVFKNKNRFNNFKLKSDELSLPGITSGNKSFENGNLNNFNESFIKEGNKQIFKVDYKKNMDEINEKLKQIIDEN